MYNICIGFVGNNLRLARQNYGLSTNNMLSGCRKLDAVCRATVSAKAIMASGKIFGSLDPNNEAVNKTPTHRQRQQQTRAWSRSRQ